MTVFTPRETMTKNEIKSLCEDDTQLQWWAMVLFAEICEVISGGYGQDRDAVFRFVQQKEAEFPRLVIQRQLERAKKKEEEPKTYDIK